MKTPARSSDASVKIDRSNKYIEVWLDEGILSFLTVTHDFKIYEDAYNIKQISNTWMYESARNDWRKISHPDALKVINMAIEKLIEKELLG